MLSLNFSPFPDLITERLVLRQITLADAPQIFILRSDKNIIRFLDREPAKSIEETEIFIQKVLEGQEKNESILWGIALRENREIIIGTTCFWRFIKEHYRAEIGYVLHSDHWQKGIMKEAVKITLEWAFTKTELHSIEANINPENIASAALLKSIGFKQEAHFRENYYYNGIFGDSIIYSLVKG